MKPSQLTGTLIWWAGLQIITLVIELSRGNKQNLVVVFTNRVTEEPAVDNNHSPTVFCEEQMCEVTAVMQLFMQVTSLPGKVKGMEPVNGLQPPLSSQTGHMECVRLHTRCVGCVCTEHTHFHMFHLQRVKGGVIKSFIKSDSECRRADSCCLHCLLCCCSQVQILCFLSSRLLPDSQSCRSALLTFHLIELCSDCREGHTGTNQMSTHAVSLRASYQQRGGSSQTSQ